MNDLKIDLIDRLIVLFNQFDDIFNKTVFENILVLKYSFDDKLIRTKVDNAIFWDKVYANREWHKQLLNQKSVDDCLIILESILKPKNIGNTDEQRADKVSVRRINQDYIKNDLIQLYISFKEYQDRYPTVKIDEFIDNFVTEFFQQKATVIFRALFIGFDSVEIEELEIDDFKLGQLSIADKLDMMNNLQNDADYMNPLSIAIGGNDTFFHKFWIQGSVNFDINNYSERIFNVSLKEAYRLIELKIEEINKTFRIFNCSEVGVRSCFYKISSRNTFFKKWSHQIFKYGDFGKYESIGIQSYSKIYNHRNETMIINSDVIGLKNINSLLKEYYKNPLDMIDLAINYYLSSFEQNIGINKFTYLMMSFEALLNNPNSDSIIDKQAILSKLENVKTKIIATDDSKKIQKLMFSLQQYKGISAGLNVGKRIVSNEVLEQKTFVNFFMPDDKNEGCSRIRNSLLHGNIDIKMNEKIIDILPQLSIYVSAILRKLILLRTKNYIDCDNSSYYEKLYSLFEK